jgi:hypothetical protein
MSFLLMAESQVIRTGSGSSMLVDKVGAMLDDRISPLAGPVHDAIFQSPDHDQVVGFFHQPTTDGATLGFHLLVVGQPVSMALKVTQRFPSFEV